MDPQRVCEPRLKRRVVDVALPVELARPSVDLAEITNLDSHRVTDGDGSDSHVGHLDCPRRVPVCPLGSRCEDEIDELA
jgi:hypothetical protein